MPVTHGVTGSSPVRTAKTVSIQKIGAVFCLYSSFPTVGQSAQNTYIPKAAHWPAGKRTLKHPQRITQKRSAFFVRVFREVLKRVFRGQKICALYFKICLTYFELCQTYFFFAPCGINALKISFQFFRPKNDNFNGNCILRTDAILSRLINGSSRPLCWFIAPNQFLVAMNRASTGGGCRA